MIVEDEGIKGISVALYEPPTMRIMNNVLDDDRARQWECESKISRKEENISTSLSSKNTKVKLPRITFFYSNVILCDPRKTHISPSADMYVTIHTNVSRTCSFVPRVLG